MSRLEPIPWLMCSKLIHWLRGWILANYQKSLSYLLDHYFPGWRLRIGHGLNPCMGKKNWVSTQWVWCHYLKMAYVVGAWIRVLGFKPWRSIHHYNIFILWRCGWRSKVVQIPYVRLGKRTEQGTPILNLFEKKKSVQ